MKRRAIIAGLLIIVGIVAVAEEVTSYRRWRDGSHTERITGERWGRYRMALQSRRSYYRPTSAPVATGVSVNRERRAQRVQTRTASDNAARVSYRWRRNIGQTEQISSFGSLTSSEIQHLATFGPQKRETFNKHLHKRLPDSVERLENGNVINWYGLRNPENVFVDGWKGEGKDKTYTSQPAPQSTKIGLEFDANGNYLSLGLGQKDR